MAIICLCNNFNDKQIKQAFEVLGKDLPEHMSAGQVYQFYLDVYEWCGLEFHQVKEAQPKCHACFKQAVDMMIERFLEDRFPQTIMQDVDTISLKANRDNQSTDIKNLL